MVSASEATSIVASHLYKPVTELVDISNSLGRVLAMPVHADRDFPPFDRVAMDGIAIHVNQFEMGQVQFEIESVAAAGSPRKTLEDQTKCIEVMTGAPIPFHTNAVIRYEDLEIKDNKATIVIDKLTAGQNIHGQAQDVKQGELLLPAGTLIASAEVALIASVGLNSIQVKSRPRTAIVSTGDELVSIEDKPAPHQIRRSNSYALQAALQSEGVSASLYHIPDKQDLIEQELKVILDDHDLIILSGGVSKGKFDFVPQALEKSGVIKHFHKVKQKPGKPFWFGHVDNKTIFALPGNPVSTYMCFYRYIQPWLRWSWGLDVQNHKASLGKDFAFKGDLTYFLQVKVTNQSGKLVALPIPGGGSGDFANLKDVNAFMELPESQQQFRSGEVFPIYYIRPQ